MSHTVYHLLASSPNCCTKRLGDRENPGAIDDADVNPRINSAEEGWDGEDRDSEDDNREVRGEDDGRKRDKNRRAQQRFRQRQKVAAHNPRHTTLPFATQRFPSFKASARDACT
jgi:hypothetical protein